MENKLSLKYIYNSRKAIQRFGKKEVSEEVMVKDQSEFVKHTTYQTLATG